jgi:hypothetical protein
MVGSMPAAQRRIVRLALVLLALAPEIEEGGG